MRIATWNVNSLKARLEKVSWWLERARPDVLLMQETKLADADAPVAAFRDLGYELAHHGEGRWNGVAIVRDAPAARASGNGDGAGGITILVSHRFSTVRMADRIVVLDGARVAQAGTHEDLMASGGPHAELYRIQAAAYRTSGHQSS